MRAIFKYIFVVYLVIYVAEAVLDKRYSQTMLWVTIGACFSLFVYGFVDNLKGATLPLLLSDLRFNYTIGGTIQQGAYLGFLVAAMVASLLLIVLRHRAVLLIGSGCLVVGMLGFSFLSDNKILLVSMIVIGLGLGTLDLLGVRLIVDFRSEKKGKYLNLSAFFHGLASMIAPIFAGLILSNGFTWRNVYLFGILLVVLFVIFFLVARLPKIIISDVPQTSILRQIITSVQDRRIWLFYILIVCYVAVENGFAVWLIEYLQKARGQSSDLSITFLSMFFFFIMTGRLLGSFIVEKIGNLKLLLIASVGALICLVLGMFGRYPLVYCLPLTGLFLSIIFPTTTAAASDEMRGSKDVQFALFFTLAGLGGIIGSWAIGVISDYIGLQIGFGFLILMVLIIVLLVTIRTRLAPNR